MCKVTKIFITLQQNTKINHYETVSEFNFPSNVRHYCWCSAHQVSKRRCDVAHGSYWRPVPDIGHHCRDSVHECAQACLRIYHYRQSGTHHQRQPAHLPYCWCRQHHTGTDAGPDARRLHQRTDVYPGSHHDSGRLEPADQSDFSPKVRTNSLGILDSTIADSADGTVRHPETNGNSRNASAYLRLVLAALWCDRTGQCHKDSQHPQGCQQAGRRAKTPKAIGRRVGS